MRRLGGMIDAAVVVLLALLVIVTVPDTGHPSNASQVVLSPLAQIGSLALNKHPEAPDD